MSGTTLESIPVLNTTWQDWKTRHPDTLVLSLNTGFVRNYDGDPYSIDSDRVLGVRAGDSSKAYPLSELRKVKQFPLRDQVGKKKVLIFFDPEAETAWATDEDGEAVESLLIYFDAWKGFFGKTPVFKARR